MTGSKEILMQRTVLILISFVALGPLRLFGQDTSPRRQEAVAGSKVSVTMKYKLTGPNVRLLTLDVLIPRSIPGRQKVVDMRYSPRPAKVYEQDGNRYAQFVLNGIPRDSEIAINLDAEVYRHGYAVAAGNEKNSAWKRKPI